MKSFEDMNKVIDLLLKVKAPTVQYIFDTKEEIEKKLQWTKNLGSSGIYIELVADTDTKCSRIDCCGFTFYFIDIDQL